MDAPTVRRKWDEFVAVIDASTDAQLAIVAALVLPSFVPVLGTVLLSQIDPTASFAPLIDAFGDRIYLALLGLAGVGYWRLGALAVAIYRRDRQRLLPP